MNAVKHSATVDEEKRRMTPIFLARREVEKRATTRNLVNVEVQISISNSIFAVAPEDGLRN